MNRPKSDGEGVYLSVVIPAYNEERVIAATLEKAHSYLSGRGRPFEIVVVDDGSGDRTADRTEAFSKKHRECRLVRNETNRGKGFTVRHGMEEARGEIVLFSDADLSTPIEESDGFIAELEGGYDLVIGSRDLPGSDVRIHQPWYREMMGRVFNRIVRLLLVRGIVDTQCGFKAFRRDALHRVLPFLQIDGYSFDVEILFLARKKGLRVLEKPVVWVNCLDTRVDALTDSIRMFVDLLRIRYYHLLGRYRKPRRELAPAGSTDAGSDNTNGRE